MIAETIQKTQKSNRLHVLANTNFRKLPCQIYKNCHGIFTKEFPRLIENNIYKLPWKNSTGGFRNMAKHIMFSCHGNENMILTWQHTLCFHVNIL